MVCPKCGTEVDESQSTCPNCGHQFKVKDDQKPEYGVHQKDYEKAKAETKKGSDNNPFDDFTKPLNDTYKQPKAPAESKFTSFFKNLFNH